MARVKARQTSTFVQVGVTPIVVPVDFGGGHFQLGDKPAFRFGSFRTHDSNAFSWYLIETTPGFYDWAKADALMAQLSGKTGVFTLYGTPAFYATSSAPDAYGHVGGASPPDNVQAAVNFVIAVLARYPQLKRFEPWNEFGMWTGTMQQSVALAAALRPHMPAGVLMSSPPFTSGQMQMQTWLNTLDPASGKRGCQLIDTISTHIYGSGPGPSTPWWTNDNGLNAAQAAMATCQVRKPLLVTEWGINSDPASAQITAFLALSGPQRQQWVERYLVGLACNGVIGWSYAFFDKLCGDQANDPYVQAGMDVAGDLAGATLGLRGYHSDTGQWQAVLDGTVWTW